MFKRLVLVAVAFAMAASVHLAFAQTQQTTTTTPIPIPTTNGAQPAVPACTPLKTLLSHRHWRDAHPLRGESPCSMPRRRAEKLKTSFFRWRTYRLLTPYSGCQGGGKWLRYTAVPGYVVDHESGCSWGAYNASSGACGPYQLNGWTSCDTSSWKDKMRHHKVAAYVLHHQGLYPAWISNW